MSRPKFCGVPPWPSCEPVPAVVAKDAVFTAEQAENMAARWFVAGFKHAKANGELPAELPEGL